jgi:uridylate kinase
MMETLTMTEPTTEQSKAAFKRIVIKLSGEALNGPEGFGIDPDRADMIAQKLKPVHDLGVEIGLVIGGGNLWRGAIGIKRGMAQPTADNMGILATVMNGLALQDAMERIGMVTRVQTAVPMNTIAEPYIRLRAVRHMEKQRIVIFTGGTGGPYFTTDTAGALRAMEIGADILIKATKVNGIYTADPKKDPTAVRLPHLTYEQVLSSRFEVMDMTAFTLCREHNLPILVLNFEAENDLIDAIKGDTSVGTLVSHNGSLL